MKILNAKYKNTAVFLFFAAFFVLGNSSAAIKSTKQDGKSWVGAAVMPNVDPKERNIFGYGRYEIIMKPARSPGSVSGFFTLCYADLTFDPKVDTQLPKDQICNGKYWRADSDDNHFEVDIEFTPTGNQPEKRAWLNGNCTPADCNLQNPKDPDAPYEPRPPLSAEALRSQQDSEKAGKSLLTVSFNGFPYDNQIYANLAPFPSTKPHAFIKSTDNIYEKYHSYSFTILPDKVQWEIGDVDKPDSRVLRLERVPEKGRMDPLGFPGFFDQKVLQDIAKTGNLDLWANIWDGRFDNGPSFGGTGATVPTPGFSSIQRIAYYKRQCKQNNETGVKECSIPSKPEEAFFIIDFEKKLFIKNGVALSIQEKDYDKVCATQKEATDKTMLLKKEGAYFPVYTSVQHVTCDKDGIKLHFCEKNTPCESQTKKENHPLP